MDPEDRTVPDNDWALRFLANVGEDFYGTLALGFRAGQVRKIIRSETSVPPSILEQRGIDFAPTEDFLQSLKIAGASEAFLKALRKAKRPQPTGGAPKKRLD